MTTAQTSLAFIKRSTRYLENITARLLLVKKRRKEKTFSAKKHAGLGEGALLKDGKIFSLSERPERKCMHRPATYGVRDV